MRCGGGGADPLRLRGIPQSSSGGGVEYVVSDFAFARRNRGFDFYNVFLYAIALSALFRRWYFVATEFISYAVIFLFHTWWYSLLGSSRPRRVWMEALTAVHAAFVFWGPQFWTTIPSNTSAFASLGGGLGSDAVGHRPWAHGSRIST